MRDTVACSMLHTGLAEMPAVANHLGQFEPRAAAFEVMNAEPLATSPSPANQAANAQGKHPLRNPGIQLSGVQQARIAALISPLGATGKQNSQTGSRTV